MPSPSPMPRGEFVSGSPERGSPVCPRNINGLFCHTLYLILETKTRIPKRQSLSSCLRKRGRH